LYFYQQHIGISINNKTVGYYKMRTMQLKTILERMTG